MQTHAMPMPAAGDATRVFAPMRESDLDEVARQESTLYDFPWTRLNFADSLVAGYCCRVFYQDGVLVAYAVMMCVLDEAHLLNLTVAPRWQRRGLARTLLSALCFHCATHRLQWLLLEVRPSNHAARQLYARCGFVEIGRRRGYYPAADGREDALVLRLDAAQALANHALD